MKRMTAAFVLLAASIALCISGSCVTENLTNHLASTLGAAKNAAQKNDRAAAYQLSVQAGQDWENAHQVLCTFQPHSRLETVDQTLAILPDLARCESLEQFAGECARVQMLAQNLQEGELPLIQNIL